MSLTLFHGPAAGNKTAHILQQIREKHRPENFMLVAPNHYQAEVCQKRFVENKTGIFSNRSFCTWPDFLHYLLKQSLPRVHRATPSLCRNLIRRLLHETAHPTFIHKKNFSGTVTELAKTFHLLKQNVLNPTRARVLFKNSTPEIRDLILIFEAYQNLMRSFDYYDEGDLNLVTLELLEANRLKLDPQLNALYFDRLFPLSLGQRQIILLLRDRFPEIEITVSYSFDFAAEDDRFFYPAFGWLGEMAKTHQHFPASEKNTAHELFSFPDPASELEWIAQKIDEEVEKGVDSQKIGVIVPPDPFYHERLAHLLEKKGIPFYPEPTLGVGCHSEQQRRIPRVYGGDPSPPLADQDDNLANAINVFLEEKISPLRDALQCAHARQEFENQWNFEAEMVFAHAVIPAEAGIPRVQAGGPRFRGDDLDQWKTEEWQKTKIRHPGNAGGIALLPLKDAFCLDFDLLFVSGFTESLYPSPKNESPFFTPEMLTQPETREILESPAWHTGLEKKWLAQSIAQTKNKVVFTYPKILWNGQEQWRARLYQDVILSAAKNPPNANGGSFGQGLRMTIEKKHAFPKLRKFNFSISELETYQQCPFEYYAKYHLKLGEQVKEELDVPADARGRFVHRVLERLYKKNHDLYLEAVDYDLYLKKFHEVILALINEESKKETVFLKTPSAVLESFFNRAALAIDNFLRKEIETIRSKKKKTLPALFEWNFGRGEIPPLKIPFEEKMVAISGRIDRIDINKELKIFSVIDYKTGDQTPSAADLKKGLSLQIPLYLMATSSLLLKDHRPAGGMVMALGDLSSKGMVIEGNGEEELFSKLYRISTDEWEELKKNIQSTVAKIVKNIHEGCFEPNPKDENHCFYCDYRDVCGWTNKT